MSDSEIPSYRPTRFTALPLEECEAAYPDVLPEQRRLVELCDRLAENSPVFNALDWWLVMQVTNIDVVEIDGLLVQVCPPTSDLDNDRDFKREMEWQRKTIEDYQRNRRLTSLHTALLKSSPEWTAFEDAVQFRVD